MRKIILNDSVNLAGSILFIVLLPILVAFGVLALGVLTLIALFCVLVYGIKLMFELAYFVVLGVMFSCGYVGKGFFNLFKKKNKLILEDDPWQEPAIEDENTETVKIP